MIKFDEHDVSSEVGGVRATSANLTGFGHCHAFLHAIGTCSMIPISELDNAIAVLTEIRDHIRAAQPGERHAPDHTEAAIEALFRDAA